MVSEFPTTKRRGSSCRLLAAGLGVCLLAGQVLQQNCWGQADRHPGLDGVPRVTLTKRGIPGDPLNVAFVGSLEDLHLAMLEAGWFPADPITLKSSLKIVAGTVFHRSYVDAPVSNLMVWGRRQDLAFEQPVGKDPRRRHHVRFWRSDKLDNQGRTLWIGAATYDTKVGLAHTTHQITHHIDPDIDKERDKLLIDLKRTGNLSVIDWVDGFQVKLTGKNGGGDPYRTDGRLAVGVMIARNRFGTPRLSPAGRPPISAPKP
jgi:LssY C-terminus